MVKNVEPEEILDIEKMKNILPFVITWEEYWKYMGKEAALPENEMPPIIIDDIIIPQIASDQASSLME